MIFDGWTAGYRVQILPWPDGEHIYVNVRYYAHGQSLEKPPVWDKSVYLTNDEGGQTLVRQFRDSLVHAVATMEIVPGKKVILSVDRLPLSCVG